MKNILIVLSLFLPLFLLSCGPSKEQAMTYNDALVDEQKLSMDKINAFFEALSKRQDSASINNTLEGARRQVSDGLVNIGKMEGFDGNTMLRDSTMGLLRVYESVLNHELAIVARNYKLPDSLYNDSIKTATDALYDQALQKMDQRLTTLEAVQKAFAEEEGIEIK